MSVKRGELESFATYKFALITAQNKAFALITPAAVLMDFMGIIAKFFSIILVFNLLKLKRLWQKWKLLLRNMYV